MDFTTNGFDWVVNLRQKFETVCIEVEDKICQEAKYLENHVQAFYEDVIQDLLPSSCMAPGKETVSGSSVVKSPDDVNEDHIKRTPSHEESEVISPVGQDCCQTADSTEDCDIHNENHFLHPSDVNLVSKGSEKTQEENGILETSKLAIENNHSVKNEKYAPHPSEVVPPVRNQASLSTSPRNTICLEPETSFEGVALSTHKDNEIPIYEQFVVDQEEKALSTEPPSLETSAMLCSSRDCSTSSCFSELCDEDHNRVSVPLPMLASTEVISSLESSQESELCCHNGLDAVECIADVSSSSQSCNLEHPAVLPTESEGSFNVDDAESCMENIELFDNIKLGESCVVVDNINLQVPPRSSNRRSLKKTLQHALASRMRSTKQREYEQLAILYGDIDADINERRADSTLCILAKDAHLKIPSAHDLCDSDWELV
ncbi:hypothetical protein AQUCO_05500016v1 [Aquilegia coerulea]|uniref:Uncharacterized protein n=1 Tax=Aquilegia coerulea TaxID=218851 RepID=A0A2G5CGK8_AQUCA|nr:hypothetical protein AQUCO_05500016v1 [Aquilegia coerulea]